MAMRRLLSQFIPYQAGIGTLDFRDVPNRP
jgi:hypothetical protein